jgi:outer membrane receptor protein involved in Fe transport
MRTIPGFTLFSSYALAMWLPTAMATDTPEAAQPASDVRLAQAGEQDPSTNSAGKTRSDIIDQVIVTAQKREESIQEVPISISVLGGADLDKRTAQGVAEALGRVSGVAATATHFGGTNVMVRGVSAGSPTFAGSSPVAYYLDTVPFGLGRSAIAPDANVYDLDRIEVLRGPQGTLFGASAQNGLVRVLTKNADLDAFEFKLRTLTSETKDGGENYRGDMAVNVPLMKGKVAARAVVGYQSLSGWIDRPNDDAANDAEIGNARLKINAQPTEELSLQASAWLSRSDQDAPSEALDDGTNPSLADEPISTDYDVYGFRIAYDFPSVSIRSETGYMDYALEDARDFSPIIPAVVFTNIDTDVVSQEIVLQSNSDGAWRWTLGGMYRDAEDRVRQRVAASRFDLSNGSESYAAFGEISGPFFSDRLGWTLGLRYFHEDASVKDNLPPAGATLTGADDTFDAVTPRAVLTWRPSTGLNLYASYAEGFRGGFPQSTTVLRAFPNFPALQPDELHNYEIGVKADLWDGRLAVETAVYYIDWQDVQQQLVVPAGGVFVSATLNGESASGMGVDFSATIEPLDGLTLGVTYSWNDLAMDADVFSRNVLLFAEGDRLNLSPETTVGASIDYSFPIGSDGYTGRLSASGNYVSEQSARSLLGTTRVIGVGDPITIARTSFSVDAPHNWSAMVFVDNATDEDGAITRSVILPIPRWSPRPRPRTVGLQFEYHFK